jgi:hypothetical protein
MMARLRFALGQVRQLSENRKTVDYFLPAWLQEGTELGVAPERLFDLRHEIACIVEELIISGNDRSDDAIDFVKSHPELFVGEKTRRQAKEVLTTRDGSAQRNMINDWFLCTLKKSRTLRFFLTTGRITPELPPTLSPDWIRPVLEFWDIDEAATGFKQLYEASDGAIDSRDDLKAEIDSKKPNGGNGNNYEARTIFPANSLDSTKFNTIRSSEPLAKSQANLRQRPCGLPDGDTQNPKSPAYRPRRSDTYSSLVTKSRSGSVYSGSSFGSVG